MTASPETTELLALKSRLDNANTRYYGGSTRIDILPEDHGTLVALVGAAIAGKSVDEECRSIIEGVKNVLEFAIGLAWDAERLIPDSEPKRLRNILNSIRQGYLKPAVERLKAASFSTTAEPKR